MNWSYIAGFFDGEGCIMLRKPQKKSSQIRVSLHQSYPNHDVLRIIQRFLEDRGIHPTFATCKPQKGQHQIPGALFMYGSENVYRFLAGVFQHLIVKRALAKLCMDACAEIRNRKKVRYSLVVAAIKAYKDGACVSVHEAQRTFGIARKTIEKYAKQQDIKFRSRSEAVSLARKKKYKKH